MNDRDQIERRLADPAPLATGALADLALDALDHGLFEQIVARIERALREGADDARLHQILALARRELLDAKGATDAFARAATLAPTDARIAHGLARSTWEAGLPAVARYDQALQLAPSDAGVLLGRVAALIAEGRGAEGEAALFRLLDENPGWYQGHEAYARIVATARTGHDGTRSVRAALIRYPLDATLWQLLIRLLLDARRHAEVIDIAHRAAAQVGASPQWQRAEAIALSEQGQADAAQAIFDRLAPPATAAALVHPIRTLIRLGRFDEAARLAERGFADPNEEATLWPYRALLWRVTGDARWHWLEGDDRLVGVHALGLSDRQLADLATLLRRLHGVSGEFADQSVRGGTQTDGNLLARAEPEIRLLREALLDATAAHVAQLPQPVAGHPTLIERRAPLRVAGSWSVRLSGAGFHSDHVHTHGWLSSAFYVALPDMVGAGAQDGWLALGECRDLLRDLDGFRTIEPKPGRLALFPSTMWHGTRPFAAGERLTVAFDIARP